MLYLFLSGVLLSSCVSKKKLEAADQQIASLNSRVDSLIKINQDCQQSVTQLKTENIAYGKEEEDCRKAKAAYAARVARFDHSLDANGKTMEEMKLKIANALAVFKDAGLEVKYRDGLVYISMFDKMMFPTGSVKIKDEGRQALSVIADAMAEFTNITTYVVGNTDTVSVLKDNKDRKYKDNWSLSTERANTIVRILKDEYGADPHRLVAAGRGKFDPIASNATEEGRALNRRVDIVLNPDLSKLWGIMEEHQ